MIACLFLDQYHSRLLFISLAVIYPLLPVLLLLQGVPLIAAPRSLSALLRRVHRESLYMVSFAPPSPNLKLAAVWLAPTYSYTASWRHLFRTPQPCAQMPLMLSPCTMTRFLPTFLLPVPLPSPSCEAPHTLPCIVPLFVRVQDPRPVARDVG